MRIALLQPSYWPEVRRGSERLVHDLGATLAARGHEVTLITSHRGPTSRAVEDGMLVVRARRPPRLSPLRWYEDHVDSMPQMAWHLLRGRFDVAHAFHPAYAWAAIKARRLGGPPVVFSFHGIPERAYLVSRRYRLEMMQAIVAGAALSSVLSEAAAEVFRRYLLIEPLVLPGGVIGRSFAVEAERAPAPTVLCAASLGDPRKRADLLFAAFARLRERRPGAELVLVRTPDPVMSPLEVAPPPGARWVEADATEAIARAYASAWATVLPAVGEAFGLVLLESLAAGTPVVCARAGGPPEIVSDERIGRLFEPADVDGLVAALEGALDLAGDPEVRALCRARAADFDWSRIVERYEDAYASVVA